MPEDKPEIDRSVAAAEALRLRAVDYTRALDEFGGDVASTGADLEVAAHDLADATRAAGPKAVRPRMTETLDAWREKRDALAAALGRKPTLAEVAKAMGRGRTAAHAAMRRLDMLARVVLVALAFAGCADQVEPGPDAGAELCSEVCETGWHEDAIGWSCDVPVSARVACEVAS